MKFHIGQKIVFLHESGGGVVNSITEEGRYIVEDEDGFERAFLTSELALVYSEDYKISEEDIQGINEDESFSYAKHHVTKEVLTGARRPIDVWELDLHIEEITESHARWSNAEILKKQMQELRSFYQRAKSKRIRKIIIIHGVGEGVLKEEVRSFFDKQDALEYYDADYREYGKGATAVELRYN
ncbi:MAG: Smr/MutS family protein [Crocinitomicaceae bacterium]|nr:Smr/MutS family protein [Crocinitomicaceae bacterium]